MSDDKPMVADLFRPREQPSAFEAIQAALFEAEIRFETSRSIMDGNECVTIFVDDDDDEDRRIELNFTERSGRLTSILSSWKRD